MIPGVLGYASNINVNDLLTFTNDRRERDGVGALTINPKLTAAAQEKAKHMFTNNYWAHVAPDGTDPWSFIIGQGYDYLYAGENLAKNFSTSSDVVEAWYKSPSHRENLISDKYTDVGFAAVNGILDGYETTLVVQMFGKTRNAPAQIEVKGADKIAADTRLESVPSYTPSVQYNPKVEIYVYAKFFSLIFASFLFVLFVMDMWYSKKHAILKFTGHSFAHTLFLIFAITIICMTLGPGRIL